MSKSIEATQIANERRATERERNTARKSDRNAKTASRVAFGGAR